MKVIEARGRMTFRQQTECREWALRALVHLHDGEDDLSSICGAQVAKLAGFWLREGQTPGKRGRPFSNPPQRALFLPSGRAHLISDPLPESVLEAWARHLPTRLWEVQYAEHELDRQGRANRAKDKRHEAAALAPRKIRLSSRTRERCTELAVRVLWEQDRGDIGAARAAFEDLDGLCGYWQGIAPRDGAECGPRAVRLLRMPNCRGVRADNPRGRATAVLGWARKYKPMQSGADADVLAVIQRALGARPSRAPESST